MNRLTYPRTAQAIATRARRSLGAYRAVPGREAAHELDRALHDMWGYATFAFHDGDDRHQWEEIMQKVLDAELHLKPATPDRPDRPVQAANAAIQVINDFERATGITPGPTPSTLYTRAEAEQAANAAFDCLNTYIQLDHWNDRRFVTRAFLAFLDDPNSPYPYPSHDSDEDDEELTPEETGERENSLLYWLGPRTDAAPRPQEDNQ
ncbi:hypothetical protein [Streptomyces sp. NPDC046988]|uniref:hypothetical protein n=1 Tax=Streptomyces sp. NPDC046988 TaxID=3154922 RepID=UPI0034084128